MMAKSEAVEELIGAADTLVLAIVSKGMAS